PSHFLQNGGQHHPPALLHSLPPWSDVLNHRSSVERLRSVAKVVTQLSCTFSLMSKMNFSHQPSSLQVGLRQLDMSLLRQLWSLREAIQEYKGSLVSDNEFSEEEEEEEEEKGEEEDEEETGVHTEPLPSSSSLSPPLPSSNSRDQWIKDSFHVP
uniref:Uncharacterized protein n=1 Tax=Mola mola TaxID=94237 RepID=A0A3Q3X237_MOLML